MAKAKTKSNKRTKSVPIKWPKNGKLSSWLERYLDVLEQGKNPARAAGKARVPLRQLAELGSEAKALKRLDRLCELSSSEVGTWVRLSLVGAEISLENLKLKRADKYLASIQDRLPKAPASKRGFLASLVQSFCAINGLDDHLEGWMITWTSTNSTKMNTTKRYKLVSVVSNTGWRFSTEISKKRWRPTNALQN